MAAPSATTYCCDCCCDVMTRTSISDRLPPAQRQPSSPRSTANRQLATAYSPQRLNRSCSTPSTSSTLPTTKFDEVVDGAGLGGRTPGIAGTMIAPASASGGQVAQVDEGERRLARHEHERPALLEHDVGGALGQVGGEPVRHRRRRSPSTRGTRSSRRSRCEPDAIASNRSSGSTTRSGASASAARGSASSASARAPRLGQRRSPSLERGDLAAGVGDMTASRRARRARSCSIRRMP